MPNFRAFWNILKRLPVIVTVEHRAKTLGGSHGFDARERGTRRVTMRPLKPRDLNRLIKEKSINEEWVKAVKGKAEEAISKVMREENCPLEEAEQQLKKGMKSVEERFQQGNVHYLLRYDFRSGKFYWRSTRRVSESNLRHENF
ncbi:MAG: hypothetical protein Q8N60_01475 [Candidatus Diapherotrites archaeon]|nr:hypothetical protein [Candidatus Diapherotrites archaeon]